MGERGEEVITCENECVSYKIRSLSGRKRQQNETVSQWHQLPAWAELGFSARGVDEGYPLWRGNLLKERTP